MGLPIAYQAGDKSGHVDDLARMAIAKLAHKHLASCEESANRLRQLGEQNFRIYNVGAPQLDNIIGQNYTSKEITIDHQKINLMILIFSCAASNFSRTRKYTHTDKIYPRCLYQHENANLDIP